MRFKKITELKFIIQSKCFQIYNDGILRAPHKWWQHIYVIYHWTIFEQLLFLINFAATLAFSIYGFINHEFVGAGTPALDYVVATISLVGNITDIMSIILGSKKRISTFSWGFVACITLGIVSYIMGTIGTAIVYIVIQMPMQFVGFYLWRRNSVNKIQIIPKRMRWWVILLIIMITAGLTTGFYFLQRLPAFYNFFHGSEEIHNQGELILDSLNLILGIVGIALMVMVFREQWIVWIIFNISNLTLFSFPDNLQPQMITLSLTALINSFYGVWNWRHDTKIKRYEV